MLGVVRIFFLVGRFHELWAVVSGSNSVGKAASVIQHFNPNHNGVKYSLAIGGGKLKKNISIKCLFWFVFDNHGLY